LPIQWKGL